LHGKGGYVDSAERRIDDSYTFERHWKKDLKLVCAFEDGKNEDATVKYKVGK
jgi:hypothetical protein